MDFIDEVKMLSVKFADRKNYLNTEEATKNSLVLPFIKLLGYDYQDPTEVVPEFTADVGTKRGEKVDYALMHNDKPAILIECKSHGSSLNHEDVYQLLRYLNVTDTRLGILTDGIAYRFFSDLDRPNVMDIEPFFEFNMAAFTESQVEELKRFTKSNFRENEVVEIAYRLKYIKDIKGRLAQERAAPSTDFVRFIMKRIRAGSLTQKDVEDYRPIVREAFSEFVKERIEARLKSPLQQTDPSDPKPPDPKPDPVHPWPPDAPHVGWTPLSQIAEVNGQKRPTAIKFKNSETRPIKFWYHVLGEVTEWLVREGHLTSADLPINGGGRGWDFINSASRKPDGRDFRDFRQISGGIYLEQHYGANRLVQDSKKLLTHYAIEHETVELQFE